MAALALLPARSAAAAAAQPRWDRGCAVPAPQDAGGYERLFHFLHTEAYSGGDGGFSVQLPDGRTLYGFGDTFQGGVTDTGARAGGTWLVHNSFLLLRRGCLEPVTGPDGMAVIPDAADGSFYWPSAGMVDRGRLYVFATHVQAAYLLQP